MPGNPIDRIYLLSHTHTDMGYTDHFDSVRLLHRHILDTVLDLCEDTFDNPDGEQMRWTCEVTSTTLDYLRTTTSRNVDRFRTLHKAGRISVGGMRYHWTPLVSKPLAIETLRDIDILRGEFDIAVRAAMQCDVNGLAWFWNDLLAARGIDFLSTHQNPHRGYRGRYVPSVWRWVNRSGGELLVHQGEHYSVGHFLRLARADQLNREELMGYLHRHAESDDWMFPYSVLSHTNVANGDNAFPDSGLADSVAAWNAKEEIPMEIITLDQLADIMAKGRDQLPVRRGEWMDSWCDGEGSSPLETAAARSAERLLPIIREFTSGDDASYRELVDILALYDEHTWGAYSTASLPNGIFSTIQRIQKSNHAYRAFALSLRLVAEHTRKAVPDEMGRVEGDPSFAALSHGEAGPDDQCYLVANPHDFDYELDWPVPIDRGAGVQISIPHAFGTDIFFPGFGLDAWYGIPDMLHRLRVGLAPREVRIIVPTRPEYSACSHGDNWIETPLTRLEIDPVTGGVLEWIDRRTGTRINAGGSLAPEVQLLKTQFKRRDLYQPPYWEHRDAPMGSNTADMLENDRRSVSLGKSFIDAGGVRLPVSFTFESGLAIDAVWTLTRHITMAAAKGCPDLSWLRPGVFRELATQTQWVW